MDTEINRYKMARINECMENKIRKVVSTTNQKMVELYMRQLPIPAFNKFLKNDYLKFWKPN